MFNDKLFDVVKEIYIRMGHGETLERAMSIPLVQEDLTRIEQENIRESIFSLKNTFGLSDQRATEIIYKGLINYLEEMYGDWRNCSV